MRETPFLESGVIRSGNSILVSAMRKATFIFCCELSLCIQFVKQCLFQCRRVLNTSSNGFGHIQSKNGFSLAPSFRRRQRINAFRYAIGRSHVSRETLVRILARSVGIITEAMPISTKFLFVTLKALWPKYCYKKDL